jgi:DNA-binding transcriptional MerR regulator
VRIGELSRRTNVSVRALRYYEEQKLLVPRRTGNGYREYDDGAVERVGQIQVLFSAGLCSGKIVELLPCIHTEEQQVVAGPALAGELETEHHRIRCQIEGMQASLRILESVLATARGRAT